MNSEPVSGRDWNALVRRGLVGLLTAALYLLGLGLGVLALMGLVRTVEFGAALLIAQYGLVAPANARGAITLLRNLTAFGGGLLLLGVAVFSLDYHFKHLGERRSLRLIALTLGVELALLALDWYVFNS